MMTKKKKRPHVGKTMGKLVRLAALLASLLLCSLILPQTVMADRFVTVKVSTYENGDLNDTSAIRTEGVFLSELEDPVEKYNPDQEVYAFGFMAVVNLLQDYTIYNVASIDIRGETYTLSDDTEYPFHDGDELWLYYYPAEISLPVLWCKETTDPGTSLKELTDEEAMWWDDNEKEKSELIIPSDHSVAISSSEGAALWTPYTLPKKTDAADGMPLTAYEIRSGGIEPAQEEGAAVSPVKILTRLKIDRKEQGRATYYLQNSATGLRIADNPDMKNAEVVTGKEMTFCVIYDEQLAGTLLPEGRDSDRPASGVENSGSGGVSSIKNNLLPFIFILAGGAALVLLLFFRRR